MTTRHAALSTLIVATLAALLASAQSPKLDHQGDPLPAGTLARLGTIRWRTASPIVVAAYIDDHSILTVNQDLLAQVWDVATGKESRHFDMAAHAAITRVGERRPLVVPASQQQVVVSGDGRRIACNTGIDAIRIWDVASGKELASVRARAWSRRGLALSHDGRTLAAATPDGKIEVYSGVGGPNPQERILKSPAAQVMRWYSLEFSAPGQPLSLIAIPRTAARNNLQVAEWDLTSDADAPRTIALPNDFNVGLISRSVFSPNHRFLAGVTGNRGLVIDLKSGQKSDELSVQGWASSLSPIAFTPDSSKLVMVSEQFSFLTIWDASSKKTVTRGGPADPRLPQPIRIRTANAYSRPVFSPDGKTVLVSRGCALLLTDLETGRVRNDLAGHLAAVRSAWFSANGKSILTFGSDGRTYSWNATSGEFEPAPEVFKRFVSYSASPDGRWLIVAGNKFNVIDIEKNTDQGVLDCGPAAYGRTVYIAPDSKTAAVVSSQDTNVAVCELPSGKKITDLRFPDPEVTDDDFGMPAMPRQFLLNTRRYWFSPGGSLLAYCDGPELFVWDWRDHRQVAKIGLPRRGESIETIAISPDDCRAAIRLESGELSIFELATGQRERILEHSQIESPRARFLQLSIDDSERPAATLAFAYGGRMLISGRQDGSLVLWDFWSGREAVRLAGHSSQPTCFTLSPDCRRLVSGSADTSALVWDITPFESCVAIRKAKLDQSRANQVWGSLLDARANGADAILALAQDQDTAIPLLRERLKAARGPDKNRVAAWVEDLNDADYRIRERATKALAQAGESVIPALRNAIQITRSAEVRTRALKLIASFSSPELHGERLRFARAIEALELIGTTDAREILKNLAAGADVSVPTRQAAATLERMTKSTEVSR